MYPLVSPCNRPQSPFIPLYLGPWSPCIPLYRTDSSPLVSDPGASTLGSRAVTDVCGVALAAARPQGRDHGDAGLLVELRLLHHDLAAVLAESVHLELDDDPPFLVQDLGELVFFHLVNVIVIGIEVIVGGN